MAMKEFPTLTTTRLVLRLCTLADAPDIQRLAADRDIASTTLRIPHPYEDGMAEQFIATHQENFDRGEQLSLGIALRSNDTVIGNIGLRLDPAQDNAEMGYWIGKPYWGQGYGTEAAAAVIRYAFEELELNRVYASHFTRNPASGRILQKIGMIHEGRLRQQVKKWEAYEDLEHYGILKSEYRTREPARETGPG